MFVFFLAFIFEASKLNFSWLHANVVFFDLQDFPD